MSNFEKLKIVSGFEPNIDLVDGIVNDLYLEHGGIDLQDTPWLVPLKAATSVRPDALTHVKIGKNEDGWALMAIQRAVGDFGFHYATKARLYQKKAQDLLLSDYTISRDNYRAHLSKFSTKDTDGEYTSELYRFLSSNILIPKSHTLSGYLDDFDTKKETKKDRKTLQLGAFLMRRCERKAIGFAPDLSDY